MKIIGVGLFRYKIPFKPGFSLKGHPLPFREGIIFRLTSDAGILGYGEISPLPGFSEESLTEAQEQITQLGPRLLNQILPEDLHDINRHFSRWFNQKFLHHSVRFGLETAVMHLTANARNVPIAQVMHKNHAGRIQLSGLLQGDEAKVVDEARRLIAEGYRSFKLKVGGSRLEEDVQRVRAVEKVLHGRALLRLDANQSWEMDQAIEFVHAIDFTDIEYIEEPLKDVFGAPKFYKETAMSVAVDESLAKLELKEIKSLEGIEVLVIKPTLYGGIARTLKLIEQAKHYGLGICLSSAYETGLGLLVLTHLASGVAHPIAAGLDTRKWFSQDLLTVGFDTEHGAMKIAADLQNPSFINPNLLEEIN